MSPMPDHGDASPGGRRALDQPDVGYLTEVSVFAGVLHAAASLEMLHDFFIGTDPAVRTQLGRFLVARRSDADTGDPGLEAAILVHELGEAADLLRALAGGGSGGQR